MTQEQIRIAVRRHAHRIGDRIVASIVENGDPDDIVAAHERYATISAEYRELMADSTAVERPHGG